MSSCCSSLSSPARESSEAERPRSEAERNMAPRAERLIEAEGSCHTKEAHTKEAHMKEAHTKEAPRGRHEEGTRGGQAHERLIEAGGTDEA